MDSVPASAIRVKRGANDLNFVDVPLNPTHSLSHSLNRETQNQKQEVKQTNNTENLNNNNETIYACTQIKY